MVPALSFFQYGIFHGVSLTEGEQPHRALIGRSFLQDMMLIYDGRRRDDRKAEAGPKSTEIRQRAAMGGISRNRCASSAASARSHSRNVTILGSFAVAFGQTIQ